MIQLSSLTKSFGERVLLDNVTWQINQGERVGLCGPNGAGKTTLLKMLAGFDEPDTGAIVKPNALTVGYLPQDGLAHAGRTILDEASSAFGQLLAVKAEMHHIEERLGDATVPQEEHNALLERYSGLQDRFRIEDGYNIDLKVATVLRGLGFSDAQFLQPTDSLSGRWQMRWEPRRSRPRWTAAWCSSSAASTNGESTARRAPSCQSIRRPPKSCARASR